MQTVSATLTVYFDGQFWMGLFENQSGKKLMVAKNVFGAEPKDCEILDFICNQFYFLKFSPGVENQKEYNLPKNPKSAQRKIKKRLDEKPIGTKSQQAMKLQIEARKSEKQKYNKIKNEQEKQEKFLLDQQKKKEKRKGH